MCMRVWELTVMYLVAGSLLAIRRKKVELCFGCMGLWPQLTIMVREQMSTVLSRLEVVREKL